MVDRSSLAETIHFEKKNLKDKTNSWIRRKFDICDIVAPEFDVVAIIRKWMI